MNPHPFQLQPDMMVGPWRIQARLGAGGFGAVFRVECDGEPFALKFAVHGPQSEDLNRTDARARRELACLLLTHHPNVVRVWAHGRWPHPRTGYHYVVMDYVEGPTLTDWVRLTRPTLRQVLVLFATLARALHALHAQDIHHRDLKGSNILVRASDGEPVLVDFGAGDHAESFPLTEGPLPPGTPHLRTPEALRFHREHYAHPLAHYPFRPTDDLYALGGTLYEVLTGVPPFPPHLPREVLTHHIETRPPVSPDALNPQVPPALAELVLRLLAKRPEERPESGQALDDALQALLREGAPALDVPLGRGTDSATTEGMEESPVTLGGDRPERPLPGTADHEQVRLPPGPLSRPNEAGPTLAPPERASPGRRGRWAALATLAVLGLLGVSLARVGAPRDGPPAPPPTAALPSAPLTPPSPPPPEPSSSLAAGEGGPSLASSSPPDAGPSTVTAAPPRPLAQKGPLMRKKSPANTPAHSPPPPQAPVPSDTGTLPKLVAVATCTLAGGCASGGLAVRPLPPIEQCPPGYEQSVERFGRTTRHSKTGQDMLYIRLLGGEESADPYALRPAPDGPFQAKVVEPVLYARLPAGTVLSGQAYRTEMRLLGRFTEARLPDGERLAVCIELRPLPQDFRREPGMFVGWVYSPEAPRESRMVEGQGQAYMVHRFINY